MPKPRGREHTTLTETAALVVKELYKIPGIKMIAPGEINTARSTRGGKRFITIVYTSAGCELIISGQSVQNVAVHTETPLILKSYLQSAKSLKKFTLKERIRIPGE